MPPGPLTLIGSGETSDRLLNLHQSLLATLPSPRPAFLDTPAGFQLNTAELYALFAGYFKKNFNLELALASFPNSAADPQPALTQLQPANYLLAGPGSPTYAVNHWRGTPVWQTVVERWRAGAHLVFASSAVIALGRHALPVYEIYKVGAPPHWTPGLDLLGPLGFDLALIPHYNNTESPHTRYCFMGEPRLLELERQLPASALIVGLDENTALTLDFAANTAAVSGAGRVVLRYRGKENALGSGSTFDLKHLQPLFALEPISSGTPPRPHHPSLPHPPAPPPPVTRHPPAKVIEWAAERNRLRAEKKYAESDLLRNKIAAVGYTVKDSPAGPLFSLTRHANPNTLPSFLDQPDTVEWSVNLLAHNNAGEILRAARSALRWSEGLAVEVVIVDNGSDDGTAEAIAALACDDERVRPVYFASNLGEGAGRNAGFRHSRGRFVMLLGGHMELGGDAFTPAAATLADDTIGATGSNGLVSADLFTFNPAPQSEADSARPMEAGEARLVDADAARLVDADAARLVDADAARLIDADAIEFYLFAFRRARLRTVGLLDEKFAFYRNLDLDWSMAFKDKGLRLVVTPGLPVVTHEHPYLRLDPAERDRLSRKNYRRFLDKWRDRKDLLLANRK